MQDVRHLMVVGVIRPGRGRVEGIAVHERVHGVIARPLLRLAAVEDVDVVPRAAINVFAIVVGVERAVLDSVVGIHLSPPGSSPRGGIAHPVGLGRGVGGAPLDRC